MPPFEGSVGATMSSSARACKATVLSPSASLVDGSVPLRGAEHWAEAMHRADASLWAECAGESCLVSYSCEKRSADVISYSAGGRESAVGDVVSENAAPIIADD